MFDSLTDLSSKLSASAYFIDPVMVQVVFLAAICVAPQCLKLPGDVRQAEFSGQRLNAPRIPTR
jgi:hypothetical protein